MVELKEQKSTFKT